MKQQFSMYRPLINQLLYAYSSRLKTEHACSHTFMVMTAVVGMFYDKNKAVILNNYCVNI